MNVYIPITKPYRQSTGHCLRGARARDLIDRRRLGGFLSSGCFYGNRIRNSRGETFDDLAHRFWITEGGLLRDPRLWSIESPEEAAFAQQFKEMSLSELESVLVELDRAGCAVGIHLEGEKNPLSVFIEGLSVTYEQMNHIDGNNVVLIDIIPQTIELIEKLGELTEAKRSKELAAIERYVKFKALLRELIFRWS